MDKYHQFYINGQWQDPVEGVVACDVVNPADEQVIAQIALGSAADVDYAVMAARTAFEFFSQISVKDRLALLQEIVDVYQRRYEDIALAISREMGAPLAFSQSEQASSGLDHIQEAMNTLEGFRWEARVGNAIVHKEPIGVIGMITPWNWPINQIACKVAPALAAGCTMVLKPTEIAPINAIIFAQILHEAGVPKGVFNLVNGMGDCVGEAMSAHPDIDMMSFTGSTRAGVCVAQASAVSVKRVTQELGGKSPNIILDSADFSEAIPRSVLHCFSNSGQSCNAPTRLLVPVHRHDEAVELAKQAALTVNVGDPMDEATDLGPVVSEVQYDKIQALIQTGIDEQATLVVGGTGRPEGLSRGYYIKPTIFAHVNNAMTIAQEEIFGPVLSILPYQDVKQAIEIANQTVYGLYAFISGDEVEAREIASHLRAGSIAINGVDADFAVPFGGYKQSGNGREWGLYGFEEFLETKAVIV